ncbi:MAG TPA: protein kinase [Candidatus Eisenbacteria bacterium]|nr:protein kinase [Candidatus Eisenbacteria bacterium]
MINKRLGPYTITEEIGAGGMATVYRAYQPSMDRHVAIKVIRTSILQDPTLRERFQREARLIARLEHPHLLPVYDFDGDHEPPYIVMRYLEGGTLKQVLAKGEIPFDEVLYMLNQVGLALDYAHRQKVVHRDLKPSNVMIDREGNAFVTDFGIARAAGSQENLTHDGDLIGTPAYMSPEQANGRSDVDQAADIYALGAMLFEMLTGSVPFRHESSLGVLMAHLSDPVPSAHARNPRIPQAVDHVIQTAMAKDKKARYPRAEAMLAELTAALKVSRAEAPTQLQSLTQTLSLEQLRAFEAQSKERRKETPTSGTPSEQQRQMTTVYLDVTDLATALYESGRDAESVRARMDGLWNRFGTIAQEGGGVIQGRTGEVGVALWGRARISEDDPERAIRAALRMRDIVLEEARGVHGASWEPTEDSPLPFSAGITTGPVLLERSTDTGTYTASGATITLAGRIKDAAPPGKILVAHDTFIQVRGIFTFHSHEPIRIRGRRDPLEVYIAVLARPRAFRLKARGIEGVETKMIGREIELRLLQEALTLTLEDGETQVVTVVGDAGVGKSRLLFEFSAWTDLIEEKFWLFEARATQPSMLQPYSLTRDLFSFRFQILDSDPLDVVHQKFVNGIAAFMGESTTEKAELIGQLVGFDFSHRPAVAEALEDAEAFRREALEHLGQFFASATRVHPIVLHVEDIHWADDRSLDLINNLVRENAKLPLFVICMARPSLYERRPQWGEGQRFHERIQLEPLSQLSSRRLVRELLKKMDEVPSELRDMIVERADGNPFYIEELIKAFIDDGVIVKGDVSWTVDRSRLSSVRVPSTLTGVLQSRLDSLPLPLQQLLQRVSVVGRMFWQAAAVHFSREEGLGADEVQSMLEDLRNREMILRREESSFAGTIEYVFRHAILRDVTYETLVPRQRRALHKLTADWLLEIGGERAGEHTLLVAEHYERAGEPALAAEQLRRAGEGATRVGARQEALTVLQRAREQVLAPEHRDVRFEVDLALAEFYSRTGNLEEGRKLIEAMLPEAREARNSLVLARGLGMLARFSMWQGDTPTAARYLEEALPLTRQVGDQKALVFILRQMGNIHQEDPAKALPLLEESVSIAQRIGDRYGEGHGLNSMGNVWALSGDAARGVEFYGRALQLAGEEGDRNAECIAAGNIASLHIQFGELDQAEREMGPVLRLAEELHDDMLIANTHENYGWLSVRKGAGEAARAHLARAIAGYRGGGVKPSWLLIFYAVLEARSGQRDRALELLGLARELGTSNLAQYQLYATIHEPEIRGDASEAEIEAAFARGAKMDMDQVLRELVGQDDPVESQPA